jgi:hypothetical protein
MFESGNQPRRILTVHNMNDKDDVGAAEVPINFLPFAIAQRRAKVIGSDTQVEFVDAIDFSLRISERRKKARTDI